MTAWRRADLHRRLLLALGALRLSALPPAERELADRIARDLEALLRSLRDD
jgi:hypothetical protein